MNANEVIGNIKIKCNHLKLNSTPINSTKYIEVFERSFVAVRKYGCVDCNEVVRKELNIVMCFFGYELYFSLHSPFLVGVHSK